MRRGRAIPVASLALGVLPIVGLAQAAAGPGSARAPVVGREVSAAREALRSFDAYPLFDAGERVNGLPLTAVLRRDDSARFVSFVYGDCAAGDDAGCAPPAEVQVWPSCRRNLDLYATADTSDSARERIVVRGVPAALFEDGTRLEVETGRATIVVFSTTRALVQRIARALRALDGSVPAEAPLPPPARGERGGAIDC
jgi:hypothetical protein